MGSPDQGSQEHSQLPFHSIRLFDAARFLCVQIELEHQFLIDDCRMSISWIGDQTPSSVVPFFHVLLLKVELVAGFVLIRPRVILFLPRIWSHTTANMTTLTFSKCL